MTTNKSQEDLEKPAKVYQLDAVIKEISDLRADMNSQLVTILGEVRGVITKTQLDQEMENIKKVVDDKITSAMKDVKLRYDPTKTTVDKWSKFGWSVLLSVVGILITQIFLIIRVVLIGGGS